MQKSAGKYLADNKSWHSFHNGSVNEHHFFSSLSPTITLRNILYDVQILLQSALTSRHQTGHARFLYTV